MSGWWNGVEETEANEIIYEKKKTTINSNQMNLFKILHETVLYIWELHSLRHQHVNYVEANTSWP